MNKKGSVERAGKVRREGLHGTMPTDKKAWIHEIALAYRDAMEAIPFGPWVGVRITVKDLYHLAPAVCLKFRGIRATKTALKKATEAALCSYIAEQDAAPEVVADPVHAFAFCYIASHFGLGLLSQKEASSILQDIEPGIPSLNKKIRE